MSEGDYETAGLILDALTAGMEKDKVYQVTSQSKPLKNKGTNKIFRVFSDVDKRTKIEARKRQGNR